MNLDRFKPPTAADDRAACQRCEAIVHYTALDDQGHCPECAHQANEAEQLDNAAGELRPPLANQ